MDNCTRILVLEDNDFDFELVERELRKMDFSYEMKRASSAQEFEELLLHYQPKLILSDFSLPSFSGKKALELAKTQYPEIPFIFVSGSIGEERAVEALKKGADDYVLKDNLNKLEPSVRRALEEAAEKTRRKEAEEKLRIKNNELRTLVYRISHDIKGPICTMQGAINLSQTAQDKEEVLLYINAIEKVTNKLDGIIKNLSNFQYIFADSVQLSDFRLDELVAEVKKSLASLDELNEIDLSFELLGDKQIRCEKNFLFSILFNLAHNAIVFSNPFAAQKKVVCRVIHEEGLRLEVEDNGMGIPENIRARIWDMFYRGHAASKGAGLGLYIVKTCADLLQGKVEMHTQENEGTRISVDIPLRNFK